MRSVLNKIGLVAVFAFVYYVFVLNTEVKSASEVCARYTAGKPIGDLSAIAKEFDLQLAGPLPVEDNPETLAAVICAQKTLCDTSCRIEYRDGVVTDAKFVKL